MSGMKSDVEGERTNDINIVLVSGVTVGGGVGRGQSAPQRVSTGKFLVTNWEKNIFLLIIVKFYGWNMLHLEDINEDVLDYGNPN